ncbi:homeobox-leucine zipper protein HDG11 [Trifolium repens]|nr:homeobox-leucine zipper protein HDG11 [Trifolium repens]
MAHFQMCPPESHATKTTPNLAKKRKREDTCVVDEEYGLGDAKECEENQSPFLSVAKSAMHEILRLLSNIDKSLWRNNINEEVGFILDQKRYMNLNSIFSKLISSDRREESSKAELIVRSSGKHLVELILDSEKWAKLFPTIVSNARTVKVFNVGAHGNRNGALQAMVGEMHILSPLVPPREFYFIRYCRQFSDRDWVIVDVSGDFQFERANVRNPAYKLPSGCLIRKCQMENLRAKMNHILTHDTNEYNIHLTSEITNPNAIRLKCRSNSNGMVVTATGSVRLHIPPQTIFHFLSDEKRRPEWDSLVGEREVHEVAYISIGEREIQSYNRISILEVITVVAHTWHYTSRVWYGMEIYNDDGGDDDDDDEEEDDNNVQIFQEVCIDPMGAYVVYAPIGTKNTHKILNEENSSDFGILPWGFMISRDGHFEDDNNDTSGSDHHKQKGSLVTFSFQVLVPAEAPLGVTMESLNSIFTATIEKIQNALDCEDDD